MTVDVETKQTRSSGTASEAGLPSILAIVVTHDGRRWLGRALTALAQQTYGPLDVLVVDDASPQRHRRPTIKRIAKRHLKSRRWGHLRTPRPLGFGGAINWAMSRVRTDARFLLFIHDDAELEPDSVEQMVDLMLAEESTAIVGPKVVDWDDPNILEEVGMAIDRFGYPYKGLEEGEIDLGQHDRASEVFYVTSTCMLVDHAVFKALRGWDARFRAYAEDLDLCWRARLAGYNVQVEPRARVKHAIAMAKGERDTPFAPPRYYIRRNRLRTIAKNAAGVRLIALIPLFLVLTVGEMIGFIVLRQPRHILSLARALGWNLLTLPQTIPERARVQRSRKVPDRKLRRYTVRESTRVRSYVAHQAERLEEAWGRRAEVLARRGEEARAFSDRMRGWPLAVGIVVLIALIFGARHLIWGPTVAIGELLPYPDRATAMWRALSSPWHAAGLGHPAPVPPGFAILGIFPIVTFGAAGAAQKLLLLGLGIFAFIGAYRLVAPLVDRASRYVAAATYAVGSVGYAGVREGDLGALVFGAAAPFVLGSMTRLAGWARPPGWNRGRAVSRAAFGVAVSAAFVPGSLVLYVAAALVLAATRTFLDRGGRALRGLTSCVVAMLVGWILLLPWSTTWFSAGGTFERLTSDETWRHHAQAFASHGAASVMLGQTPDGPALFGLALVVLGVVAVVVGEGQRRRMALVFWLLIGIDAWVVSLIASGAIRPFIATPSEAGVMAALSFSGLAGLAAGAFRLDLPRRGLGLMHAATLGGVALAVFLAVAGLGPAFLRGEWKPGGGSDVASSAEIDQISDLLETEVSEAGSFRALWVGERYMPPVSSGARPTEGYSLTGARGPVLTELFPKAGRSDADLDHVISSIEAGSTDVGGSLLGAFNVRFVVLERGPGTFRWTSQRDLAIVRSEIDYLLLETADHLPRLAAYKRPPKYLSVVTGDDLDALPSGLEPEQVVGDQSGPARYNIERAKGPAFAALTESFDPGWEAQVDGKHLAPAEGGWANAFTVPSGTAGKFSVTYPRSLGHLVMLLAIALAWIVVAGSAFSRTRRTPRGVEVAR